MLENSFVIISIVDAKILKDAKKLEIALEKYRA